MKITEDERLEARLLIEDLLDLWVQAAKAEANPEAGLAPADARARRNLGIRTRPEIVLSGSFIRAMERNGIDIETTCLLEQTADPANPDGAMSQNVPASNEYIGFVRVDQRFWAELKPRLTMFWNRAIGDRQSAPRFAPPTGTDEESLDEWLRSRKATLRRCSRSPQRKAAPPKQVTDPPFVIVFDSHVMAYKVRAPGVSPSVKLAGNEARIMGALIKRIEKSYGKLPRVPRDLDVTKVRSGWQSAGVTLTYDDLAACCPMRGKTKGASFSQVAGQLSATSSLSPDEKAIIRKRVERFNAVWAKAWKESKTATGDPGVVLAPLGKGTWVLKTPILTA